MASVVRRASLLVQLIFNFVRFSIVQRTSSWIQSHTKRKTNVTELKRKISTADEDNFFDICSAPADEEQSTLSKRCDACKEESRKVSFGKKFPKKKKRTWFKKEKVSPIEKIAWENNGARGAEKGKRHTVSLFTSRSAKASNVKNDFDTPCYKRENDGKFSKASSSLQASGKEGAQFARQSSDVSYSQQGTSKMQTGRNRHSEAASTPGPCRRSCDEISQDRNSGSFKQEERLRSKLTFKWKGFRPKKGKKTTTGVPTRLSEDQSPSGPKAKEEVKLPSSHSSKIAFKWKDFRGKREKRTTTGMSTRESEDPSPSGPKAKEINFPSSHRSKIAFKWKAFRGKRQKKTTTGMSSSDSEEPSPSGLKAKEEVNLPSSHSSKISVKWNGFKKRGRSPKSKLPTSIPPPPGTYQHSGPPAGSRSRITFRWNSLRGKKKRNVLKTGKPATDALHPGFGKLKKSLDRPNDLRSRISGLKWEGLKRKKGQKSDTVKQKADSVTSFSTGMDLHVDKCDEAVTGQCTLNRPTEATDKVHKDVTERIKKTSRVSRLLSRFK